jgi:hypothetical protein
MTHCLGKDWDAMTGAGAGDGGSHCVAAGSYDLLRYDPMWLYYLHSTRVG